MACRECGAKNAPEMKFCTRCGVALAIRCASCDFDNPPGSKYCGSCGAGLEDLSPAEEPIPASEAERRQLTVMFCDMVGSTAMSTDLDPEDMRDVIRSYQGACAGVVTRYEGFVAKYMGDGVLVYFGYPNAHEDDAERAINTGLGIVAAVNELEHDLAVRIGIATGMVVVGDIVGEGASQEAAITGETPNLAARLQEIAEPNAVVIAETTRTLAGGMFELNDLGGHDFKGFAETVWVWSVSGARRAESRFDATRAKDLTELIGRDEEMEILLRRWQRAKVGEGQVVLISGEPGIGKSRLARELQDRIAGEPYYRLRHQCSPYHTNSALYPVIERLERAAGFESGDEVETKLAKLDALIDLSGNLIEETAPLFASLLSIPAGERYPPLNVSPQRQKELTLQSLVDQLAGIATKRPVLFVMEDAHWIDPTTLELMKLTVERSTNAAVLLLITYRPEFDAPWVGRPRVTPMILGRLERRDCERMVAGVTGGDVLPDAVRDKISEQTDGVPLFIEELTRSVLETAIGAEGPADAIMIPASLQDSLEARLDRLGSAKEVSQIGAVIGRKFDFGLLARVVPFEDEALRDNLGQLVSSGLLTARGTPPAATYTFKHALVQDTAYNSLLRSRRAELHGRIAQAITAQDPEIASSKPELLAHHYTEAGLVKSAIEHWHAAGRLSMRRSGPKEAIEHLRRGLNLLSTVREASDRDRLELSLQSALGPALLSAEGWGSADAEECFVRARDLSRSVGDERELFPILWGYWMMYGHRRETGPRHAIEAELSEIARKHDDPWMLVQAHHAGWGNPFQGDFSSQLAHVERGLSIYDKERDGPLAAQFGGHDAGVCGLLHKGLALSATGYPEQSLQVMAQAEFLASELSHAPTSAQLSSNRGMLHAMRGDWAEALRFSDDAISISKDFGVPQLSRAILIRGWARVALGDDEAGVEDTRRGMEMMLAGHSALGAATCIAFCAEVFHMTGSTDEALSTVERSLPQMIEGAEGLWLANAHGLRGDIFLAQSGDGQSKAEACYLEAIEFARSQSARLWELRSATRLARLWHSQGKTTEARDLLAPLYGWFTEGFDTADLKETKILLDELS